MNPDSLLVRCNHCGTKNRIPKNRLQDRPICGKCRSPLPPPVMHDRPVIITDQTFHNEIILSLSPTLVNCWAQWCTTCSMLTPILLDLARKYAGRAKIAKLNVDQNPIIASKFHVQSVPTLLFFKNGRMINRLAGGFPKEEIERQLLAIM
ncbi:MAG: thiol reductase thioredoxin [Desulfobacterales bacterium]|nr:MAG: thiol reductase thioredoxin [Desulfobacterales bacterium]